MDGYIAFQKTSKLARRYFDALLFQISEQGGERGALFAGKIFQDPGAICPAQCAQSQRRATISRIHDFSPCPSGCWSACIHSRKLTRSCSRSVCAKGDALCGRPRSRSTKRAATSNPTSSSTALTCAVEPSHE